MNQPIQRDAPRGPASPSAVASTVSALASASLATVGDSAREAAWASVATGLQAVGYVQKQIPDTRRDDVLALRGAADETAQTAMSDLVQRLRMRGRFDMDDASRDQLQRYVDDVRQSGNPNLVGPSRGLFGSEGLLTTAGVKEVERRMGRYLSVSANGSSVLESSDPDVAALSSRPIQLMRDGVGPKVERTYGIVLPPGTDPDKVFSGLAKDFPSYIDQKHAHFYTTKPGPLTTGDLIPIHAHVDPKLAGISIGPNAIGHGVLTAVRVDSADPQKREIILSTVEGHPEAGSIMFFVNKRPDGSVEVAIHSAARAGSDAARVGYDSFGKQVQTEIWTTFLERVGQAAGHNVQASQVQHTFREF